MFEVALEALRIVQQGLTSNWWGLGCPAHCRGTDLGGLSASFLLGFVAATGLWAFLLARWHFAPFAFFPRATSVLGSCQLSQAPSEGLLA